jgi:ribonuclease T2
MSHAHRCLPNRILTSRIGCFLTFGALFALVALTAGPAGAQERRQNQPGAFDVYVLSLSWTATFCDAAAARAPGQPAPPECGQRALPFVVHGLWPQYEKGFPEFCQQPAPRLDRGVLRPRMRLRRRPPKSRTLS